jgi:murein DD-endopeptidase MepM/ murein hydrolase activator NlpD
MPAEISTESRDVESREEVDPGDGGRRPVSHRRTPEPGARRRAPRPAAPPMDPLAILSPRPRGHRKAKRSLAPASGTPTIVAGAAVLAVAAVGALNGAGEPPRQDTSRQNVAQALPEEPAAPVAASQAKAITSAATLSEDAAVPATASATPSAAAALKAAVPGVQAALDAQDVALQRAVKASRDRARLELASRTRAAAAAAAKEAAVAKAAAAAKARAARMALLAKSYSLPVKGYHLTARFGQSGGRWSHNHTGLDFACRTGTEIHAVASGTVVSAGWDGPYGWKTVIRHADGTETWYAHQSSFVVRSGHVDAGDVIGHVGSTGNTTGPHLHLEVVINGSPVDPDRWLSAHGLNP